MSRHATPGNEKYGLIKNDDCLFNNLFRIVLISDSKMVILNVASDKWRMRTEVTARYREREDAKPKFSRVYFDVSTQINMIGANSKQKR